MKKIYFLLLAAIVGMASSADAAPLRPQFEKSAPKAIMKRQQAREGASRAGSKYDGTYYLGLGDYYFQGSVGQVTIQVEVAVSGDSIIISETNQDWLPMPVKAPFNAETGVISFEPYIIFDSDGEIDMFVPTLFDQIKNQLTFSSFKAVYNEETSSFIIPADCGFSWPAWKGANAAADAAALNQQTVAGWYGVYDVESLETNKDYVLAATTDYICPTGADIKVNLAVGSDIAKVYCVAISGQYSASEGQNGSLVIKYGQEVPVGNSLTLEIPDESGLYSYMFAGVNVADRVVATATTYQIIDLENDSDWQPVPEMKTMFTEGLIAELFGLSPEQIEVELQQSVKTPGRFRFEAPYSRHSMAQAMEIVDQKNYIYVNATDNLRVYVEPSALGIIIGEYGAPYVFSWPALSVGTPDFDKENPNNFGRYIDGKILAPAITSFNNEPFNIDAPSSLTLTLTKDASISQISAEATAGKAYDLNGRRVAVPARGLYIINGKKAIFK